MLGRHGFTSSSAPPLDLLCEFSRPMDRHADAPVGPTPANVSDLPVNLAVRGVWVARQQSGGGHDLTGLTVATLRHVVLDPGPLHGMLAVGGHALDGDDVAVEHRTQRQDTRTRRAAVHVHRTRPALRDTTAVLSTCQAKVIAQDP